MTYPEFELTELDTHNLLGTEEVMLAPQDLDVFFKSMYEYHSNKGLTGLILAPLYQISLHLFVILMTGLVIGCTDWEALSRCEEPTPLKDYVSFKRISSGAPAIFASIFVVLTVSYVAWKSIIEYSKLGNWIKIKKFYTNNLGIQNVSTVTWNQVVKKLSELQVRHPILLNKRELDPLDVAIRVLRSENYMVALVQEDILKCEYLDEVVMWNIWWTLVNPLFNKNSWQITIDATGFRARCLFLMILNTTLLPLTILLRVSFFLLKLSEMAASSRPTTELRKWSDMAKWVAREYNEYPHILDSRLKESSSSATEYLDTHPSYTSRSACALVKFVSGSIVGCITLLAAFQDDALVNLHVLDRNLLWWLAVWTGIFTLARVVQPSFCRLRPEIMDASLKKLKKKMKYYPDKWEGSDHLLVQKDLSKFFPYFFVSWGRSLISIIKVPFLLYKWSTRSQEISYFISSITENHPVHGDICTFSSFQDRHQEGSKVHNSCSSFRELNLPDEQTDL